MVPEAKRRIRWLTREEADRLLLELPEHLENMAQFTLATGLRETNAVMVLRRQVGKHPLRVFTYAGEPVTRANNHAWRNALIRAGIENFRWHDLRHTWASPIVDRFYFEDGPTA